MRENLDSKDLWSADEIALTEVRRFNQKLAWLPRFRIRNRVMPFVIQSLLRMSQIGGAYKLAKCGLQAENRVIALDDARVPV